MSSSIPGWPALSPSLAARGLGMQLSLGLLCWSYKARGEKHPEHPRGFGGERVPRAQGARGQQRAPGCSGGSEVSAPGSGTVPSPCHSPACLTAEGTGKAGAAVLQRLGSLENK